MRALSLNFKFGFFVNLCFAHLAGGINLKKGGRKGLVNFSNARLNPNKNDLNLLLFIPYIFLNSAGNVLKAVKEIKGQIGLICLGTGPPSIIS